MTFEDDDFLEHFGVKGMKWGVRKNRDASDTRKVKIKALATASAVAVIAAGAATAAVYIRNGGHLRLPKADYDYSFPNVDIGPQGLSEFRFPTS